MDSILDTIKTMLGIETENTSLDADIISKINVAFVLLNGLGLGPLTPFSITSKDEVWLDFFGEDEESQSIKDFIYFKVFPIINPPTTTVVLESILDSIKKMLGIDSLDTAFDVEIIININSVFMILNQLGIGPTEPYLITSKYQVWDDFFGTGPKLESVKTYIYLKVRLAFDPPTGGVLEAIQRQITEYEWRITAQAEKGETT